VLPRKQDSEDRDMETLAFERLDHVMRSQDDPTIGIGRQTILNALEATMLDPKEREHLEQLLDKVVPTADKTLTLTDWLEFCKAYEEEIMSSGHINSTVHNILLVVDQFQVDTWNNFMQYRQSTWASAVASVLLVIAFLVIAGFSIADFWTDAKLAIRQQTTANGYESAEVSRFFFFVRTPWWESLLDPALFSFEMSYYTKRNDPSTGEIIEEYEKVPWKIVKKESVSWWPDSISSDVVGVAPEAPSVSLSGAYYMNYFHQLEVRLVACMNSTSPGAVVCRSEAEQRNALHGGSVNLVSYSPDTYESVPRSKYWTLVMDETKQVDLWYGRKTVEKTPKTPIHHTEASTVLPLKASTEQISPSWGDGTLAVFWFSQDSEMMTETHVREDLTTLVGSLGGNWASLLSVFGLVALLYNRHALESSIKLLRERSRQTEDLRIAAALNRRSLRMARHRPTKVPGTGAAELTNGDQAELDSKV